MQLEQLESIATVSRQSHMVAHPSSEAAARAHTGRQLAQSLEAIALAPALYLAWARLGLVITPWHELTAAEQAPVFDAAAVVIRLADPIAMDTALAAVASAIRTEHPQHAFAAAVRQGLAATATDALLKHLAGYPGGVK